ncbi:hypothetical protein PAPPERLAPAPP_05150 [Brevundimonas phage vB_BpoS-Papperlapapp]|uniref:Uncharacterized protein n=2 Tax=Marchewkavirus TaxID=3425052 RepID=A0A9E7MQ03_9CAUD|nr:hypothetical protein KABACHOK_03520 [Brevundimonas phage vB_BpoS-Kabachok]USN14883.1 hypothetical protein DOMOVOI_04090 [Brevundimonas phage vB_BpoS-Domovoi]USN16256.1 hypothetical protein PAPPERLAPAPP_05150 [Brevundimonas phage vB_BpoS-Papperlapapp]
MHTRQPEEFARILDEAAEHIARQPIHPGQSLPGLWNLDDDSHEPARLIGVIVASALAQVCKTGDCDLQEALASYAAVSHNIPLVAKGGPDVIAAQNLRDAARTLREARH